MINLILKLVRLIYVQDRTLNFVFDEKSKKISLDEESLSYTRKGGNLAQYGGRFVLMSYDDFSEILPPDYLETFKNLSNLKEKNQDLYIENYNKLTKDFYIKYKDIIEGSFNNGLTEGNLNGIKVLNEEFSHHALIRDTPTWVILNALTVYYRICSCYMTYFRYHNKKFDKKVSESLLNTYLIRSQIVNLTYPIVEASYHYKDNQEEISNQYGKEVKEWCDKFDKIEEYLKIKIENKNTIKKLMTLIQKVFLTFPFINIIVNSKLDYIKFIEYCNNSFIKKNNTIYEDLIKNIESNNFSSDTLEQRLKAEIENWTTNTQLDKEFRASLMYLGTETTEGFIPNSLKWFVFKRLLVCKNKPVLFSILIKSNKKGVDNSYDEYPPIKCVGPNKQSLCVDESMKIFKGNSFIIAQNSFEPTLAGENGYVSIVDSKICKTLLIQALLIKSLSLLFINKEFSEEQFIQEFNPLLSAVAEGENKDWLTKVLIMIYVKAKEILKNYNSLGDFKVEDVAENFEKCIEELQKWLKDIDENKKKLFLNFCDINYVHGY